MLISTDYRTLTPAYGRDYKSKKEVEADWNAEKDFLLQPENAYVNKQQFSSGVKVCIRYSRITKVTVVKA